MRKFLLEKIRQWGYEHIKIMAYMAHWNALSPKYERTFEHARLELACAILEFKIAVFKSLLPKGKA